MTIVTEIKVTWFITLRTFGINWSTQLFRALFPDSSNDLNFDDDNLTLYFFRTKARSFKVSLN